MFSLADKIALVTGAGSGISGEKAIARAVSGPPAQRYMLPIATQLMGSSVLPDQWATRHPSSRSTWPMKCPARHATEIVMARHGRVDILVNNAGIGHVGALPQTTSGDLDRLLGGQRPPVPSTYARQ